MDGNLHQLDPQTAAEKAVTIIGFGYDLSNDIRLSACKPGPSGSRLIELDTAVSRDLVFPGAVVVKNVPSTIRCDKGERTRFRFDVLSFNQMSEKFNQDISLSGKVPSRLLNAMFEFKGCWPKDTGATKSHAYDGWFITLYSVELERAHLTLSERVRQEVPSAWDPAVIAEFIEKYGTHVITGVKMGDERFSENGETPEFSGKPKDEPYMPWDLQGMLAASVRPPVVTHSKNNDIVIVYILRGGADFSQSRSGGSRLYRGLPKLYQGPLCLLLLY
ncbi:ethylene-responsive transcription factor 4-like [Hibiscus syriacus]|uniref:Ethylene-responsive transcription factor 4-like n=1 Tax=Hibiscus syriacus TaxID=106335 RepID=A0A6A2WBZ9_HIBSY|nr:ethylene-responsive transcription factor 4-like [Hibiscus syriacus]